MDGNNGEPSNQDPPNHTDGETHNTHEPQTTFEDIDSSCSTPYVSAPSSPGRGPVTGFFYSAPSSPMHFALSIALTKTPPQTSSMDDFEFSARFGSSGYGTGSMSSADELFLNGKIRPMKLSTHLEQPQVLAPLLDLEAEVDEYDADQLGVRGRDLRLRDKSLRRRTRSLSPLRNMGFEWAENEGGDEDMSLANKNGCLEVEDNEREKIEGLCSDTTTPSASASSSRSSSAGRSSKRWVFLKDFLRSKSEGRSNNKFWSTISFAPTKEKKPGNQTLPNLVTKDHKDNKLNNSVSAPSEAAKGKGNAHVSTKKAAGKPANGVGKRRQVPRSPHELHYTANRAQAEEMKKKTFLPYRQGLLGCLGFSSKGYGAMNGFARALNPVSSR
jgi:hypothetical protein